MEVGELVGRGRTSDVYAYGQDSVVKIARAEVPLDWPVFEAELTRAVWAMGVAAPQVRDVVEVHGRSSVVFERIAGPSMWQQMIADPQQAPVLARELASIQKTLVAIGIPPGLPDLVDRLSRKIRGAASLSASDRSEAITIVEDLPRGAALLHGDLHPGNVLMGRNGPVVIDWFDAAIGHPIADVVRSSILMKSDWGGPRHLPGATNKILQVVRRSYLAEFNAELHFCEADLARWQGVIAAGRLAEGAEFDERGLIALWEARSGDDAARSLLVS